MNRWFRAAGTLVLAGALTACGGGGGDDDETPPNAAPVARAGADQTVDVGATVSLDGSGSSDADGDSLTYQWSITTKPDASAAALSSATAQKPTFVADAAGTYTLQLTVSDGKDTSAADAVTITVNDDDAPPNGKPIASAGADQTVDVGDTVSLDGSASSDPDGDTLTYQWSITDKPATSAAALSSTTAQKPTFVADVPGTYMLRLIVSDGRDTSPADAVSVKVNGQPVANAGVAQTITLGQRATLDGRASSDPEDDALTFKWSIKSRPAGSTAQLSSAVARQPVLVPDVVGAYVVSLIVNDGRLDSAPSEVTVTASLPPSAPAAVARVALDAVAVGSVVTLDGSASSDADGDPLIYKWTLGTKPATSTATLDDRAAVKPTFTPDVEGTYAAQLIVNDGTSDSEPARVTVVAVKVKSIGEEVADPASGLKLTVILSEVSDAGGGRKTYKLRLSARNDTAAAIADKPMALVFDTGDVTDFSGFTPQTIAAGATFTREYDFNVPAEWVPLVWQYDPNPTSPRLDATKLQWLMPIPTTP